MSEKSIIDFFKYVNSLDIMFNMFTLLEGNMLLKVYLQKTYGVI